MVDVKSTGLFATDPELIANGAKVDYWKTGHSHIKRRVRDLSALAGFEKSGHFFFNAPVGRGYDDGFVTAIAILDMLDRNPGKSMADLKVAIQRDTMVGSFAHGHAMPEPVKEAVYLVVSSSFSSDGSSADAVRQLVQVVRAAR